MKIFLIGYRCTGKTTIGSMLAARRHYDFLDMDQVIEQQTGVPISRLVETHGWDYFRSIEKKILFKTEKLDDTVVSTGGGIITDTENQAFIRRNGYAVWLDADLKTILSRMKSDPSTESSRPALTLKNLFEETQEILKIRRPLYERVAFLRIETDFLSTEEITGIIERRLYVGQ